MASNSTRSPEPSSQHRARIVLAIGFALVGLWILRDFLPALAWAVVLSIALWPLYRRLPLPNAASHRVVAPLLLTLAVAVVFAAPLIVLGAAIIQETKVIIPVIIAARHHGIPVPDWLAQLPVVGSPIADWWHSNLSDPEMADDLFGRLNPRIFAEWAREYSGAVVHRVVTFLFTLLTLFFLFRDGGSLAESLRTLSDRIIGERGRMIASHVIAAVHGTVNGLVLVGIAEGVILGLAYLVAGLPYPASIGAATGVLAIIPFGAPVVYSVAALYMLSLGKTLSAIIIFGSGSVVVFVADHFIRPILIGGQARVPFLFVLLGLLGGLETFGIIGLFLGPAIMAALIALWREWTETPAAENAPPTPVRRSISGGHRAPRR